MSERDEMAREWRKFESLTVKPNDLIIVKSDNHDFSLEDMRTMVDKTKALGVLFMPRDGEMFLASDEELAKFGLMRIPGWVPNEA